MKAYDLIHNGYYLLGGTEIVRFYALNGGFYTIDGEWAGSPMADDVSDEIKARLPDGSLESVQPIPLTPEILEKNGFKNTRTYEWEEGIMVTKWRYCTKDYRYSITVLHAPKYDGFTWNGCDVGFVHLLQRALCLCGLDELAENFIV